MTRRRSRSRQGIGPKLTVAGLVAIGLIVVAFVAVTLTRDEDGRGAFQGGVDDGASAAARTGAASVAGAGRFFERIGQAWTAVDRVEALERENAELREWRSLALALAERNARYEKLLSMPADPFAEAARPGAGVSARLTIQGGGPFRRTLLANAGAEHGVRRGHVAVSEHGLVGRVVTLGARTSRVLMLDDYNSRVPVVGQSSRVRAMLVGQSRSAPRLDLGGIAVEPPKLEFIVGAPSLREGERIVTSGDGGIFPAGLYIGSAVRDQDGVWRVRLASAVAPVDFVRLLPFAPPSTPETEPAPAALDPPAPIPAPRAPRAQPDAAAPVVAAAAPVRAPPPPAAKRTPRPAPEVDDVDAPPPPEAGPPQ